MEGLKLALVILFISFVSNELIFSTQAREYHRLPLGPNERGPESIVFDCEGKGPYVGISDGRILKWRGKQIGWSEFAITAPNRSNSCNGVYNSPMEQYCGRPLGLKLNNATCELYIADSSFGLMKVGRNGGVATSLATSAEGRPFRFTNGLDIDFESGVVYFTDTSTRYHRWEYLEAIINGDRSGRLMKYDPDTRKVTILLNNLYFANGVALSKKRDFVVVAETGANQTIKFWLSGPKAGTSKVFLRLAGRPDNINRDANGDFWISQRPAKPIKVDGYGRILECLDSDEVVISSDISEFNHRIWVGSFDESYVIYTS